MDHKTLIAISSLMVLLLVVNVSTQGGRSGNCPLKSTVTRCMNRCKTDYDCSSGKKCCPNICGSQSCADASSISSGSDSRYSSAVYCNNVKCQSGERCVLDKKTKREKCGRA